MTRSTAPMPTSQALAEIEAVLDRIEPGRTGLDARARLELVRHARRVRDRLDALAAVLVGEADRANASLSVAGTPLKSWLAQGEVLSSKEAAAAIGQARNLSAHPELAEAATSGGIRAGQAQAIGKVLQSLAPQLDPSQQSHAERIMVSLAGHLDADQLARSAAQVLAEVAPLDANALQETRLQREHEAAHRARSLRFFREGGSVRFEGSLPRVPGEKFLALINAHLEAHRRTAIEARDPLADQTSFEQRRADALISLLDRLDKTRPTPGVGGARVIVKLDYAALHDSAAGAGVIGSDEQLSAGELRRLCCDAGIVPVVLNGASEVMDVGRASRLVTAPIRTALTLRDGGCTFPGCDAQPEICEAHHLVPWWAGGPTALSNLALLCHTHHALVEPAKYGLRDQWEVRLSEDGVPEFIPPGRLDPQRRPQRHRRHGPPLAA